MPDTPPPHCQAEGAHPADQTHPLLFAQMQDAIGQKQAVSGRQASRIAGFGIFTSRPNGVVTPHSTSDAIANQE